MLVLGSWVQSTAMNGGRLNGLTVIGGVVKFPRFRVVVMAPTSGVVGRASFVFSLSLTSSHLSLSLRASLSLP